MANLNLSEFGEKLFVADADHTFIWDTAASISKRVSRNSWLNSGTLTSDAPVTISQTWNGTGSTVFKALVVNATTPGTTSSSSSLLLDLQVGTVSQFSVRKDGFVQVVGGMASPGGIYTTASANLSFGWLNSYTFGLSSAGILGWTSGSDARGAPDTILLRDSASGNTLALRNGAAAQTFNVYGTYSTSPSLAYSRLAIACDTSGNATLTTQSTGVAGTVSINGVPVGRGKGSSVVRNISIGENSLGLNSTGADNTAIGYYALGGNGAGAYNTSVGSQSLFSSNSNHNVALGYLAGTFKTGGVTNNPGNENIYIGSQTKALDTAQTNQIVIGYDATGIGSNSVVLGNDSITKTALKGNVGIGTTSPTSKLHVNGAIIQKPDTSATPATNGDLVVEATSNTLLTFKLKGTDGTVRTGTIALA